MQREDGTEPIFIPILGFKPLIGVIHLPSLPSMRREGGEIEQIIDYAVSEAKKLEDSGFDAVIVENFGDKPYHVDPSDDLILLTTMTVIVREIIRTTSLVVGVNVLRNGGTAALAIANAAGARFVRVNSYCETRLSPEGILKPLGAQLEDLRSRISRYIAIYTDVDVKHSWGLTPREETIKECVVRGLMDAIVVSGARTGDAPAPGYVASIRKLAAGKPILIGSGITINNINQYWNIADGFIVGTSIKMGSTMSPISIEKARNIAQRVRELRRSNEITLGGRTPPTL